MTGTRPKAFTPNPADQEVYGRLYKLYRSLHDALGVAGNQQDLSTLMKELLTIRDEARAREP